MAVIKVEEGTGDEKVTKVYTIPYNSVKGEIKGYTADKKGQNGWELPRGGATKQAAKPKFSVADYNKAKGKNYTIEQIQTAFGNQYDIVP